MIDFNDNVVFETLSKEGRLVIALYESDCYEYNWHIAWTMSNSIKACFEFHPMT